MSTARLVKLGIALVVILAALYVGAAWWVARSALDAEVKALGERPSAFGLAYEEVEFSPRGWDELTLRGWWMPAEEARGTVIRVHGVDSNRNSLLGLAAPLAAAGYSVLAFDLRGHGESDDARMGAGLDERDDVLGAIDYVVRERGAGAIFLHGNSYGGAIALMAGWREPRVRGVFADSAFASLPDLVVQEVARRTVLPSWAASALRPGIGLVSRWVYGIDLNDVQPAEDAGEYGFALGLAHCRPDERISLAHLERIRAALRLTPYLEIYEDCPHSDAWDVHPMRYAAAVIEYLDARLGR